MNSRSVETKKKLLEHFFSGGWRQIIFFLNMRKVKSRVSRKSCTFVHAPFKQKSWRERERERERENENKHENKMFNTTIPI